MKAGTWGGGKRSNLFFCYSKRAYDLFKSPQQTKSFMNFIIYTQLSLKIKIMISDTLSDPLIFGGGGAEEGGV